MQGWRRKLLAFAGIAALLPVALWLSRGYGTTGPYDAVGVPVLWYGRMVAAALLVLGLAAFVLSFLHPRLTLWFGEASTNRSRAIYGRVMLIAVGLWFETDLVGHLNHAIEQRTIARVFEEVQPGQTVGDARAAALSRFFGKHLDYGGGGLPGMRDPPPRGHTGLQYPGIVRADRLVLQATPLPEGRNVEREEYEARRILRMWLVLDDEVRATK